MPYRDKEQQLAYHREYRKRKRRKRGLQKQGRKELTPEQRILSLEKRKQYERTYNKQHPWRSLDLKTRLLRNAKARAKKNGWDFDITHEDLIIPEKCPYLGITLKSFQERYQVRRDVATIDRVDSFKGYTRDNIEVISHKANTMKSNATREELLLFAHEILRRYGE